MNSSNASFFINRIALDTNKNDGPDNVERVHKSPEPPETVKNLNLLLTMILGIFKT